MIQYRGGLPRREGREEAASDCGSRSIVVTCPREDRSSCTLMQRACPCCDWSDGLSSSDAKRISHRTSIVNSLEYAVADLKLGYHGEH